MEIFGAWLFGIGLLLHPIIFIIGCILSIKYQDVTYLNETILNVLAYSQFLCWLLIVSGMLLVYYF